MVRTRAMFFIMLMFWQCCSPPPAAAEKRIALIVAGQQSTFDRNRRVPTWLTTEKDASQLRYVLQSAGYEVTLLSNTEAARTGRDQDRPLYKNIQAQLDQIQTDQQLDNRSSVIIVMAGLAEKLAGSIAKGQPIRQEGDRREPPSTLFFAADDAPERFFFAPRPGADAVTEHDKLISIESVWDRLSRCGASSKLMVLDVCRRNLLGPNELAGFATKLPALPRPPDGVAVLCSCSPGESSLDEPRYLGSGVFLHHVLCGLHGCADGSLPNSKPDDAVSIAELGEYVRVHVPAHLEMSHLEKGQTKLHENFVQHPQLLGECASEVPLLKLDRSLSGKVAGERRTFSIHGKTDCSMVWCPPGRTVTGAPDFKARQRYDPQRVETILSLGFWIAQTELTQSQWKAVMNTEPWSMQPEQQYHQLGADIPAVHISHQQAVEFCRKLTELHHKSRTLPVNWEFRLPSDAQWEYACRAGTTTLWSFGDDVNLLPNHAWFDGHKNKALQRAQPVSQKRPNPWHLYDMHGNVAEWTSETDDIGYLRTPGYDTVYRAVRGGLITGRIARGGHIFIGDVYSHTYRETGPTAAPWTGFRLALCPIAN